MSPAPYNLRTFLRTYLWSQWRQVLLLLALVLLTIGCELANPLLVRRFIDTATAGGSLSTLIVLAIVFLIIAFATQGIAVAVTAIATRVSWRATNQLRTDLTRHCLRMDLPFHAEHTPGELVERVDGDVTNLGNLFSHFVVQMLGNVLLLFGIVAVSFGIDWRIGLTLAICTLVTLILLAALGNLGVKPWEAQSKRRADLYSFVEERLSGTEDLRALGATDYIMRGLAQRWRAVIGTLQRAVLLASVPFNVMLLMMTISLVASLGVGIMLFQHGQATIGTLYLIFAYAEMLRTPVEEISRQLQDLQQATASIVRTTDLLSARSALADGPGVDLPASGLTLIFDHVDFSYAPELQTLRDITFSVPAGTTLGLLGRTGSGKTTITRLLFRFYDPAGGAIRLGDVDLRELRLDDLRTRIGLVTQDIQLFHATIRDNLTFFDATVPDERIAAALEEVGLGTWLRNLPQGLSTMLAPDGSGLSSGEAQLLAFARVFLQDPAVVVLDEASSRLDPATERVIETAVARLLHGRTGIIIAHRLRTIQQVDAIMILEDGCIREYGPRETLMRQADSRYAELLRVGMEEALR
jgi:ABC-type multidrug transport system fused ATPase/permease subunit